MAGRWREEDCFRYGRAYFDLDSLDSYAVPPTTRTAPCRTQRRKPRQPPSASRGRPSRRRAEARATPAKIPLREHDPALVRLEAQGKLTT
jgi:hypothetical protein